MRGDIAREHIFVECSLYLNESCNSELVDGDSTTKHGYWWRGIMDAK